MTLSPSLAEVSDLALAIGASPSVALYTTYRPHWNIAPGQNHWVVMDEVANVRGPQPRSSKRLLLPAFWGMHRKAGAQLLINARVETVRTSPRFRDAFASHRCAVLADGFYEWHGPTKDRRPYWFHLPDKKPFLLAGVCDPGRPGTNQPPSFVVLTQPAVGSVKAIHDRMPIVMTATELEPWLKQGKLGASPVELPFVEVSKHVSRAENDDARCIEPVSAGDEGKMPQAGEQLSLFGKR